MTTPFKLIHVLVVDDDPVQQALMQAHLERLGVKYYWLTASGEEALAKLRSGELIHVVLTDNTMPGMGGLKLVEEIRADPLLRHLKIAMFSGELTKDCGEAEAELRSHLWRHNVLPVPKDCLDTAVVRRIIQTLVHI